MLDRVGTTIKQLRIQNNWTQEKLARKLNVSLSTVGRWERDSGVIPATRYLLELSLLFGVSLNVLIGMEKENTIALDMMTSRQQTLLEKLVIEFQSGHETRQSRALTDRQSEIIRLLFDEFRT